MGTGAGGEPGTADHGVGVGPWSLTKIPHGWEWEGFRGVAGLCQQTGAVRRVLQGLELP